MCWASCTRFHLVHETHPILRTCKQGTRLPISSYHPSRHRFVDVVWMAVGMAKPMDMVSHIAKVCIFCPLLMLFHVVFLNRTLSFNDVCLAFCFPGHGVRWFCMYTPACWFNSRCSDSLMVEMERNSFAGFASSKNLCISLQLRRLSAVSFLDCAHVVDSGLKTQIVRPGAPWRKKEQAPAKCFQRRSRVYFTWSKFCWTLLPGFTALRDNVVTIHTAL